jgi:hypothetical protein
MAKTQKKAQKKIQRNAKTRVAKTPSKPSALKAPAKKAAARKAAVKKAEVAAERARTRAMWKSQADDANATELAKHGALVDERARVRSNIGMSWANRKPR